LTSPSGHGSPVATEASHRVGEDGFDIHAGHDANFKNSSTMKIALK
jgi:hypothetical protein